MASCQTLGGMAVRDQFAWDGIVGGRTTRHIRKKLARLPGPARVEVARNAMTAVAADLPTDDAVVKRYLGYFRMGQSVQEPEVPDGAFTNSDGEETELFSDPLEIRQSDYFDVWDKTGAVDDFRRQKAIETLSRATMIADGDDQSVNYPSVEQTINHAVITLRHDDARRDALVEAIRAAVDGA